MARPLSGNPAATHLWPGADRREREREAKREAVLLAAARLFNTRGYHATALDDVATALRVTKPTIYHYFANKDEILFECLRRGLDGLAEAARQASAQGGTAADRLQAVLTAYGILITDDFGICVARTQDHLLSPESRARFRALKREVDGILRGVIAEGQADGSLAVRDARIAAFTAAGALNGLGQWFDPAGPHSREDVARATAEVLMGGMIARKGF